MKKLWSITSTIGLLITLIISTTHSAFAAPSLLLLNTGEIKTGTVIALQITNEPSVNYTVNITPENNNFIQLHKNGNAYIYFISSAAGTNTIRLKSESSTLATLEIPVASDSTNFSTESGTALELNNATGSSTTHFTPGGTATQGFLWQISNITTASPKSSTAYHFLNSNNGSTTWVKENKTTNDFNIYLNQSKVTLDSVLNINGSIADGTLFWSGISNGLLDIYKSTNTSNATTFLPASTYHRSYVQSSVNGSETFITWLENNKLWVCSYNGAEDCSTTKRTIYTIDSPAGDTLQSTTLSQKYASAIIQTASNNSKLIMCQIKTGTSYTAVLAEDPPGTICDNGVSQNTLSSGIAKAINGREQHLTWYKDTDAAPFEIYYGNYEYLYHTANQPIALTTGSSTDNKNPSLYLSCRENELYITYEDWQYGNADTVLKRISPLTSAAQLRIDETQYFLYGDSNNQSNPNFVHQGMVNKLFPTYRCNEPQIIINYLENTTTATQIKKATLTQDTTKKLYLSKVFNINNNNQGEKYNQLKLIPGGELANTADLALEFAFPGEKWQTIALNNTTIGAHSYFKADIPNPFRQEFIQVRININQQNAKLNRLILQQTEEQSIAQEFEPKPIPDPTDRPVILLFKVDNVLSGNYSFNYTGPETATAQNQTLQTYLDYGTYTFTITNLNTNKLTAGTNYSLVPTKNNQFTLDVPKGEDTLNFTILTVSETVKEDIKKESEETQENIPPLAEPINQPGKAQNETTATKPPSKDTPPATMPASTGTTLSDTRNTGSTQELFTEYTFQQKSEEAPLSEIGGTEEHETKSLTTGEQEATKKFFVEIPKRLIQRRPSISTEQTIRKVQINNIQPNSTLSELDLIVGVAPQSNETIYFYIFSESGEFTLLGSTKVTPDNTFQFSNRKQLPLRGEVLLAASQENNKLTILSGKTTADIIPINLIEFHEEISIVPTLATNLIESSIRFTSNAKLLPTRQKEILTVYRTKEQKNIQVSLAGTVFGQDTSNLTVEGLLSSNMKTHPASISRQKPNHFTLIIETKDLKNGEHQLLVNSYNKDLHKARTMAFPFKLTDKSEQFTIIAGIMAPFREPPVYLSLLLLIFTASFATIITRKRESIKVLHRAWSLALIIVLALEVATSGWLYGQAMAISLHQNDIINLPGDRATHTYSQLGSAESIFGLAAEDQRMFEYVYDRLVRMNDDLNITPELAVSWSILDDYHWQIKLRQGIAFHSNEQFSEKDVLETLKFINEKQLPIAPLYANIKKISNPAPNILLIETRKPSPYLMHKLAYLPIVSATDLIKWDGSNIPNGTGPFKVVYNSATETRLAKVTAPKYHIDKKLPGKYLTLQSIPNIFVKLEEAKKGKNSTINGLTPKVAEQAREYGFESRETTGVESIFLMFNNTSEALQNMSFKKTLITAIDKSEIVNTYSYPAKPLHQFTNPGILGFNGALEKKLAEKQKQNTKLRPSLLSLHYPKSLKKVAAEISKQLKEKGISTKPVEHKDSEYFANISNGLDGPYLLKWSFGLGDSIDFLEFMISSSSPFNKGYYHNTQANKLITQASNEFNKTKKAKLIREIMQVISMDDPAGIPLITVRSISANKSSPNTIKLWALRRLTNQP